jgi:hypothetical protein
MTEMFCDQCGREIKSRESHLTGVRDAMPYHIHLACREAFMRVGRAEQGNEKK